MANSSYSSSTRAGFSTLVIASHNQGKVKEIADLLGPYNLKVHSAMSLGVPDIEETGKSFQENACLKARHCAQFTRLPSLADDSGLEIRVLDGQPGIYSARWAKPMSGHEAQGGRDFSEAMHIIHERMRVAQIKKGMTDTIARFVCVLALALPQGEIASYEGVIEGEIVWPPRGERGFGYDAIFRAHGDILSFAELEPAAKHAKSHRADAFAKFIRAQFG